MSPKMTRRAKVTFLLSVGTILNLLGYLYITGSWSMFFQSSTPKKKFSQFSEHRLERELSELLHRAVNIHNMSPKNLTNLVNRLLPVDHHIGGIGTEEITSLEKKKLVGNQSGSEKKDESPAVGNKVKVASKQESGHAMRAEELQEPPPGAKKEVAVVAETKREAPVVAVEKKEDGAKKEPMQKPAEAQPKGKIMSAIDAFVKGEKVAPVNPHDFNYQINEPQKCFNPDGSLREVFFLVLICTIHKNFENRNAIRQSWGSPVDFDGRKVITMFLLAKRSDEKLQRAVVAESEQYHDIIMEDFDDTYKNLTLKTIMGMKWMSTYCAHAKYLMKTDDDMYVSYANLIKYLSDSPDTGFVTGMVINGGPIRDPKSKWYMPKDLYKEPRYPPFCSGTGYAMSGDVPPKIYETSLSTPYLYLEDVYVAICLHKLKIVPKNHREFHNWRTTYTFCHYKRILTAHMVTPTQMIRYWDDQKTNTHKCT